VGTPYYAPRYRPSRHDSYVQAIAAPPRRLRIAMSTRFTTGEPIHPDCVAAVEHTAHLLESLGHEVVPADAGVPIEQFMRQWSLIVACGTQLMVNTRLEQLGRSDAGDDIEGVTRLACEMADGVSGAQYLAAVDFVHSVGRTAARFLQGHDMFLTATMAEPPALIGRFAPSRTDAWQSFIDYRLQHVLPYSPFTPLANGTGQPAMSLPLFVNAAGLPVGTHVMGRAGEDEVLLQLAAQLEQADPWFHRRPPL
jgi:amidase/6-aminohexanoate-cyclic-dimer hydrolase